MPLADPTIVNFDGTYYLYGTVAGGPATTNDGFPVYTSANLEQWVGPCGARDGFALKRGDTFGDKGFWAPQVFRRDGKYYMAYTANEHIAMAMSDNPRGPFVNADKLAFESATKQIDPFVFFDDDGRAYLYHVRLGGGNSIWVAAMTDTLMGIRPETLRLCVKSEAGWEDTKKVAAPPIAEGPTVVKHGGYYYLFYSANDFRSPDYAVGYAVSASPLGPWKKAADNPLIHGRMVGESGTGHGDLIQDKAGRWFYVLHAHASAQSVHPRKVGLVAVEFVPAAGGPDRVVIHPKSFRPLQAPVPAP